MTASTLSEHSFSIYDLEMRNIGSSKGEDLFTLIRGMNAAIVDSNSEWKLRSQVEPHRAFVLGRTIDHEAANLDGVFVNQKVSGGRRNVFTFGIQAPGGPRTIIIHRLDTHFKAIFNGRLPALSELTPEERAHWNDPSSRLELRDQIAGALQSASKDFLRASIAARAPRCVGNYPLSCVTASLAYALMLKEAVQRDGNELQKFIANDENLFGDTCLLQEGLLFGASLLSKDGHVRRMALYCGLTCLS